MKAEKLKPMIRKLTHEITAWLLASFLLVACALPSLVSPVSTPLPPQTPVPGILNTIIAQTAFAAQTRTATVLPTLTSTPTQTPSPFPSMTQEVFTFTPTFTFVFPTMTPVVITSPPQVPVEILSTTLGDPISDDDPAKFVTKTSNEWDCKVIEKSPPQGASIKQKSSLIVSWTILNTGKKAWPNNGIDFVYTGGYRHDGKPIQDLSTTIAPGGRVTLKISLTAPKVPGTYNVIWSLKVGNTFFCHMLHTFEVN